MKISDLRAGEENGDVVLRAKVSFQGREDGCFYSVPGKYADFADLESANCFLVGMLYPAMRYGEDIHVEGTVSMDLARARGVDLRREINALDLFRARMLNGRLHTFIRNSPLLKRLAKGFFR